MLPLITTASALFSWLATRVASKAVVKVSVKSLFLLSRLAIGLKRVPKGTLNQKLQVSKVLPMINKLANKVNIHKILPTSLTAGSSVDKLLYAWQGWVSIKMLDQWVNGVLSSYAFEKYLVMMEEFSHKIYEVGKFDSRAFKNNKMILSSMMDMFTKHGIVGNLPSISSYFVNTKIIGSMEDYFSYHADYIKDISIGEKEKFSTKGNLFIRKPNDYFSVMISLSILFYFSEWNAYLDNKTDEEIDKINRDFNYFRDHFIRLIGEIEIEIGNQPMKVKNHTNYMELIGDFIQNVSYSEMKIDLNWNEFRDLKDFNLDTPYNMVTMLSVLFGDIDISLIEDEGGKNEL